MSLKTLKIFKAPKLDNSSLATQRRDSHLTKKQQQLQLRENAKEEYELLMKAQLWGAAPSPLFVHEHMIVMEFIGNSSGEAAPLLRAAKIKNRFALAVIFADTMRKVRLLYQHANLVHGRLGDDNIYLRGNTVCFLDFSGAICLSEPEHIDALDQDLVSVRALICTLGLQEDGEKWALWSVETMKQYVTACAAEAVCKLLKECSRGWKGQRFGQLNSITGW